MKSPTQYRVVITGSVLPECARASVVDNLVELFHSRPERITPLLQGKPTVLTKIYAKAEAEQICAAIRQAGAQCQIQAVAADLEPGEAQSDSAETSPDSAESSSRKQAESTAESATESEADSEPKSRSYADPALDPSHRALLDFVQSNREYYARQFAKICDLKRPLPMAISWHWPSLFGFYFWAAYRKMYLWAGLNLASSVMTLMVPQPLLLQLVCMLFWPICANFLYFMHARRCLKKGKTHRGGVSQRAVVGAIMAVVLAAFLLQDVFHLVVGQRSLDTVQARLDGFASLQRGDGSEIIRFRELDVAQIKTIATFAVTGLQLRANLRNQDTADQRAAVASFQREFAQQPRLDGWGRRIELRNNANSLLLISAGPDGAFDNLDDMLLHIRLPNYL